MKQYGRTLNLKDDPELIRRYVKYHRGVWPEVERGLRAIGIKRMLIFLHGRRLFMALEAADGFDPKRDFARFEASSPKVREWQELMATMQEPVAEAKPGEWWADMKLVYSLKPR